MKMYKVRKAIASWRDTRLAQGQNCISEANTANNTELINNKSNNQKPENRMQKPVSISNLRTAAVENNIRDFYSDLRWYVDQVLDGDPDAIDLIWNSVGACLHYTSHACSIQFRLWEKSCGHLGIPDMTLILINLSFRDDNDSTKEAAFSQWLRQTARIYGFRHIADENEPAMTDREDQIPGCKIACISIA